MVSIASYLPTSSLALFAVALTAPSEAWLSDTSKAIISASQDSWETLDFSDFGDVANKLSDDDLRALLVCIDAKNKVKTLRLGSCTLLVGHGLEPLRGSTVLKDIDLRSNTVDGQTTPFSQASILSILENILDIEGGLKKHLNMGRDIPKEWRRDSDFVQKFKQLLRCKGTTCDAHENFLSTHANETNCLGEPSVACLTCFRSLCDVCQHSDEEYIYQADGYDDSILTCDKCGVTMCKDSCENFAHCDGCGSKFCSVCKEDDDVDAALRCDYVDEPLRSCYCDETRCLSCGPGCGQCLGLHVPRLETLVERLAGDNETLKNEINQLRKENNRLRQENKVV